MERRSMTQAIRIFTTCPPSVEASSTPAGPGPSYRSRITEAARWSEAAGCEGILVYADNRLVDPWLVSQTIIEATERLSPLVAVQPAYMHPYSVAKMVATLGHLYGRKLYLNMVAGGFKRDLEALNDFTPHDDRYVRLEEYSRIIRDLALGSARNRAVTFKGSYYSVEGLKLSPPLPPEIAPEFFVSGSSEAGMNAAAALGALAIQYPQPAGTYGAGTFSPDQRRGVRVGIIARENADLAWQVADERFPPDRRGQIAHQLAMKTSDSSWHRDLSERPAIEDDPESPYWLRPFHSYQTFCPYLVGSYERVSAEIGAYVSAGFGTFILDVPASEPELASIRTVFETVRDGPG
jgi:alkanesulfonate monooxygenase